MSEGIGFVELIRAYVEGYRGSPDAPGFEACVEAEINKRFAEKDTQIAVLREALELLAWQTKAAGEHGCFENWQTSYKRAKQALSISAANAIEKRKRHWLPIDTAPRDDTEYLIFCPKHGKICSVSFDEATADWWPVSINGNQANASIVIDNDFGEPSHWMPMPEPPEMK